MAWAVASRFVAGEAVQAAMSASKALNDQGMSVTLDFLGESVADATQARAARDEIARLLDEIAAAGVNANVSLKLTQLGMQIEPQMAEENLRYLLERARQHGNRIRIDMEDSPWTDTTLQIYRSVRDSAGLDNTGVVIQSYLYRSEADVARLIQEGAWVRLCKGAYAEPAAVAFPKKVDTDANYVRLMQMLLSEEARERGVYAGIATHDDNMINATIAYAQDNNIPPTAFEFQMLYGIRRERQLALVRQGYQMRVYVPYGTAWYPYFMRRLAERPANLWFFVSNFFRG
ncbi:MAG: proline dehydrogenase family protein [Ardenticatenales bacterium]|nr:proline dehydrogenase family protein [Ardenticatenales bacterium]